MITTRCCCPPTFCDLTYNISQKMQERQKLKVRFEAECKAFNQSIANNQGQSLDVKSVLQAAESLRKLSTELLKRKEEVNKTHRFLNISAKVAMCGVVFTNLSTNALLGASSVTNCADSGFWLAFCLITASIACLSPYATQSFQSWYDKIRQEKIYLDTLEEQEIIEEQFVEQIFEVLKKLQVLRDHQLNGKLDEIILMSNPGFAHISPEIALADEVQKLQTAFVEGVKKLPARMRVQTSWTKAFDLIGLAGRISRASTPMLLYEDEESINQAASEFADAHPNLQSELLGTSSGSSSSMQSDTSIPIPDPISESGAAIHEEDLMALVPKASDIFDQLQERKRLRRIFDKEWESLTVAIEKGEGIDVEEITKIVDRLQGLNEELLQIKIQIEEKYAKIHYVLGFTKAGMLVTSGISAALLAATVLTSCDERNIWRIICIVTAVISGLTALGNLGLQLWNDRIEERKVHLEGLEDEESREERILERLVQLLKDYKNVSEEGIDTKLNTIVDNLSNFGKEIAKKDDCSTRAKLAESLHEACFDTIKELTPHQGALCERALKAMEAAAAMKTPQAPDHVVVDIPNGDVDAYNEREAEAFAMRFPTVQDALRAARP